MMSLMPMLLGRQRSSSPRWRAGSSRRSTFPIVAGLVSLALAGPGLFFLKSTAYAAPAHTVNVLPQLKTTVSVIQTATGPALQAVSSLGGQTFTQVIDLTASPSADPTACPILDLQLGPIDLNLLGLQVTTSQICLDITAYQGGGLLGDLLCGVANLLNQGTPLGTILSGLSQAQLNTLVTGLTDLINGALGAVTTTGAPGTPGASTPSVTGSAAGSCDILNLSLGPIDLTLLGLEVVLDNCNSGPVTVDITAIPSGGLLGQLLCAVDNLLNNGAAGAAITSLLSEISRVISGLV